MKPSTNPDREERIAHEVEQTLQSRFTLESDPFFYDKLKARMEREMLPEQQSRLTLAWARPAALACFLVLSTTYTVSVALSGSPDQSAQSESGLTEQLADEFYLSSEQEFESLYN